MLGTALWSLFHLFFKVPFDKVIVWDPEKWSFANILYIIWAKISLLWMLMVCNWDIKKCRMLYTSSCQCMNVTKFQTLQKYNGFKMFIILSQQLWLILVSVLEVSKWSLTSSLPRQICLAKKVKAEFGIYIWSNFKPSVASCKTGSSL